MKASRIFPACALVLLFSIEVVADPIIVPRDVVDACRANTEFTFQECMARSGWPSENITVQESPACNLNTCLAVVSSQMETMTQTVDGQELSIPYRNRLGFVRPTTSMSDWKIIAASNMNLVGLQRMLQTRVQESLPENSCEVEYKVTSQSGSVSGDLYIHQAVISSDFQLCTNVPCIPEAWKTCIAKAPLGNTNSQLIVKVRFYIEDSKLKVSVDSNLTPGPTPDRVKDLFNLEQFFNFATGGIARSGNERQYREAIQYAITAAVAQSGEKISQRLNVPGGQAFKFQVNGIKLSMLSNQLMLGLNASGAVPASMMCDVRQSLLQQPNQICEGGR